MKSIHKSIIFSAGLTLSLLGLSSHSNAQEGLGGSEVWPEKLQSLYREVMRSHQALQQQYPDAQIPAELQSWLERFTTAPFSDPQSLQGLGQVGEQLSQKYNSSQLNQTPGNQQQFDQFINLVRNISSDLTGSISGQNTQPSISLEELGKVHNTNQQWIDNKGRELAAQYQNLNIEGVLMSLKNSIQELQQQQSQK